MEYEIKRLNNLLKESEIERNEIRNTNVDLHSKNMSNNQTTNELKISIKNLKKKLNDKENQYRIISLKLRDALKYKEKYNELEAISKAKLIKEHNKWKQLKESHWQTLKKISEIPNADIDVNSIKNELKNWKEKYENCKNATYNLNNRISKLEIEKRDIHKKMSSMKKKIIDYEDDNHKLKRMNENLIKDAMSYDKAKEYNKLKNNFEIQLKDRGLNNGKLNNNIHRQYGDSRTYSFGNTIDSGISTIGDSNPKTWNEKQVCKWLLHNLPQSLKNNGTAGTYANLFKVHGITGRKLLVLDKVALKYIGINDEDVHAIYAIIKTLKEQYVITGYNSRLPSRTVSISMSQIDNHNMQMSGSNKIDRRSSSITMDRRSNSKKMDNEKDSLVKQFYNLFNECKDELNVIESIDKDEIDKLQEKQKILQRKILQLQSIFDQCNKKALGDEYDVMEYDLDNLKKQLQSIYDIAAKTIVNETDGKTKNDNESNESSFFNSKESSIVKTDELVDKFNEIVINCNKELDKIDDQDKDSMQKLEEKQKMLQKKILELQRIYDRCSKDDIGKDYDLMTKKLSNIKNILDKLNGCFADVKEYFETVNKIRNELHEIDINEDEDEMDKIHDTKNVLKQGISDLEPMLKKINEDAVGNREYTRIKDQLEGFKKRNTVLSKFS